MTAEVNTCPCPRPILDDLQRCVRCGLSLAAPPKKKRPPKPKKSISYMLGTIFVSILCFPMLFLHAINLMNAWWESLFTKKLPTKRKHPGDV